MVLGWKIRVVLAEAKMLSDSVMQDMLLSLLRLFRTVNAGRPVENDYDEEHTTKDEAQQCGAAERSGCSLQSNDHVELHIVFELFATSALLVVFSHIRNTLVTHSFHLFVVDSETPQLPS